MKLTPRQQYSLQLICDTFAPADDGWPSASELGVPQAIADAMDFNPRRGDHKQFLQLLNFWNSQLHTIISLKRVSRFSRLSEEARVRVLLSWAESSLGRRRAAFQALRKAVSYLYVMLPRFSNARTPVWDKIGYPGPPNLGDRPRSSHALATLVPQQDTKLSCEICIIGSGAGGGTAAAVLAAAGSDVIILEAGGYYDDADFDGAELAGYQRLYAEGGSAATADHSVGLLAGQCLGGGTVVNYTTSFRTPDDIRAEWTASGVPWFTSNEYSRSLDAVCARLSVNKNHNRISAREQILDRGLRALGWHVDAMPRNVVGCDQGEICGYCGLGCALGAKQSVTKTWITDAQKNHARIITETRAQKIRIEAGHATGVEAVSKSGHRVYIICKSVVVACGAIHTPALLRRSGLRNEHIGKHLHLHPVSDVNDLFDEEIRPWEGTMQAIYSDEHRSMTGNFGVKYETTAMQPVIAVPALPWRNPQQHRSFLAWLSNTVGIGVLPLDKDGGSVPTDPQGLPVAPFALSPFGR